MKDFENRLPPQSVELELAILGAMLFAVDCIPQARTLLKPEDFYRRAHGVAFSAICDTYYAEGEVDQLLLAEVLKGRGQLEEVGGVVFLAELAESVTTAVCLALHARIVQEKAQARRGIEEAANLISSLYEDPGPTVLQVGMEKLRAVVEAGIEQGEGADGFAAMQEARGEYDARKELWLQGRKYAGLDCGFEDINRRINGLLPKRLVVLGADSSVGKTTLACQMFHSVITHGGAGGYITIEESLSDIGGRLSCIEACVDSEQYQKGALDVPSEAAVAAAQVKLRALSWWCYDDCRSLDSIEQQIRLGHRRKHVDLWVIDHLHEVTHRGDNRHLELKNIVLRLKMLAKELDTCILLPAQLARAKDRADRRPRMDDLRESGSIEEIADVVMLIHRPGRYDHIREAAGRDERAMQELMAKAQVLCEKVRKGKVGTVNLVWRNDVGLFANALHRSM